MHPFTMRLPLLAGCSGLAAALLDISGMSMTSAFNAGTWPSTPHSTVALDFLADELAWQDRAEFRGRVLTLVLVDSSEPVTTTDLEEVAYSWKRETGMEYRSLGFRWLHIPTLAPYGQLISPVLDRATREFFGVPGDTWVRNLLTLRKYDATLARMLGVRFVVADSYLEELGTPVKTIEAGSLTPLAIYEVTGSNTRGYSPTEVLVGNSWTATVAAIRADGFDPAHSVILESSAAAELRAIPGLVSVHESAILKEGPGLRVTATSTRTSLLVLPFEFSHCLRLDSIDVSASPQPTLLRSNGFLVGILFSGQLNAVLTFDSSPVGLASCRLADIDDWRHYYAA